MKKKTEVLLFCAAVAVLAASTVGYSMNKEAKTVDRCVAMATKMYNNPVSGKVVTLISKNKVNGERYDLVLESDWAMAYQTVEHSWKCETFSRNGEPMIRMSRK